MVLLLLSLNSRTQTTAIDSLRKTLAAATSVPDQLNALFALCEQRQSMNKDSFYRYAELARNLADQTRDPAQIELAAYFYSNSLIRKGELDEAIQITNLQLTRLTWDKNRNAYTKFLLQKGQYFIRTSQYREALAVFFGLLSESEQRRDTVMQVNACNNIGWVNMEMGQNTQALEWFYRALATGKNVAPDYFSVVYSNLAAVYNEIKRNDSAEYFVRKAIAINRRSQANLQFLANSLAIEADILIDTHRKQLAEAPLNEMVAIRKQVGEPFYIVSDMTQLALYYASVGQPVRGIQLCEVGIGMARQYKLDSKLPILYEALAENYRSAGKYEQYGQAMQHLVALKDSLYEKNSAEALAALQAQYNLEKVQNTVITQQLDITRKDYAISRKNYQLFGAAAITLFVLLASFFTFKNYRRRQALKTQLLLQDEKNRAALDVVEARETERKRIAADLHDNLGAYAASIASNIDNLKSSQPGLATVPALGDLRSNAQEMVSQLNDTIWVMKKDALALTAISDRLKIFIQRIASAYPAISLDVLEDISRDHLLPPSQAFHLFRILQEAVNNALRHSGGNNVTVVIFGDSSWSVTVTDNGRGLDDESPSTGNGLANMKSRAEESGWELSWNQLKSGGTVVRISPYTTN